MKSNRMTSPLTAYFRFVIHHRRLVYGLVALLSLAAAAMVSQGVIASSIGKMFFGDAPEYRRDLDLIVMTTVILGFGFLPFAIGDYFTTDMVGTLLPGVPGQSHLTLWHDRKLAACDCPLSAASFQRSAKQSGQ